MLLNGESDRGSILHDLVRHIRHLIDKLYLSARREIDFIPVERDTSLEFRNDYGPFGQEGIYLYTSGEDLPKVRVADKMVAEWDEPGTFASYSVGSEMSAVRRHLTTLAEKDEHIYERWGVPIPAHVTAAPPDFKLKVITEKEMQVNLFDLRQRVMWHHRYDSGADGRRYWHKLPAHTRSTSEDLPNEIDDSSLELTMALIRLQEEGNLAGLSDLKRELEEMAIEPTEQHTSAAKKKRTAKSVRKKSDLRRSTWNTHPAHARAIQKALERNFDNAALRQLFVDGAEVVAKSIWQVTGRISPAVSVHLDTNLGHWNSWNHGSEQVIYQVGKSERVRVRRTAPNYNSSGNLLAWDRVSRAFASVGKSYERLLPATVEAMRSKEEQALERQGRPCGDIAITRKIDAWVEARLKELGLEKELEEGLQEFVENEELRIEAGIAGVSAVSVKELVQRKRQLTEQIRHLEEEATPGVNRIPARLRKALEEGPEDLRLKSPEESVEILVQRALQFERIKKLLKKVLVALAKGIDEVTKVVKELWSEMEWKWPKPSQPKKKPSKELEM